MKFFCEFLLPVLTQAVELIRIARFLNRLDFKADIAGCGAACPED